MKDNITRREHVDSYGEFVDEIMARMEIFKNQRTFSINSLTSTSHSSNPAANATVNGFTQSTLPKSTVRRRQPTSSMIESSPAKSTCSVESCNSNSILVWSLVGESSLECQYLRRFCGLNTNRCNASLNTSKSKSSKYSKKLKVSSKTNMNRLQKTSIRHSKSNVSSTSEHSRFSSSEEHISSQPFKCSRTSVSYDYYKDERVRKNVFEKRKTRSDSHLFKRSQCSTQCLPLEHQHFAYSSRRSGGHLKQTPHSKSTETKLSLKNSMSHLHRRCASHLNKKYILKNRRQKTSQSFSKTTSDSDGKENELSSRKVTRKTDIQKDRKCTTPPRNKHSIFKKIRQFCKHLKDSSNRDTRTLAIL